VWTIISLRVSSHRYQSPRHGSKPSVGQPLQLHHFRITSRRCTRSIGSVHGRAISSYDRPSWFVSKIPNPMEGVYNPSAKTIPVCYRSSRELKRLSIQQTLRTIVNTCCSLCYYAKTRGNIGNLSSCERSQFDLLTSFFYL
jgi:hypothetical protein